MPTAPLIQENRKEREKERKKINTIPERQIESENESELLMQQ